MKQIINKQSNGKIEYKYYLNHLDQKNGLSIYYWNNGKIHWKANWVNGKKIGLHNSYNNKPTNITYHL